MTQPLFFEPEVHFEKLAMETALPEDPNQWPNAVLQELYKQIPYLSDFEVQITMDQVDGERGFGFGHAEVSNRTEAPHGTPQEQMSAAGIRRARLPVVIKDSMLQPFDLVLTEDSKMLPLTEQRLRQVLFRPQSFDVTSKTPGDQSMIGQLYPPYRQNYGFGGGGVAVNSGTGGKTASVLEVALSRANEADLDDFKASLRDENVKAAYVMNPATYEAVEKIAATSPMSLQKMAEVPLHLLKPSVLQLRKVEDGYSLKVASHHLWSPAEEVIDRGEAFRRCGEKVVLAADMTGSATVGDEGGVEEEGPTGGEVDLVSTPGVYQVQTEDGQPLQGAVLPNLLDIDCSPLPIALFTDGQSTAVQSDIAGAQISDMVQMEGVPAAEASGVGAFWSPEAQTATVPLSLSGSYQAGEEPGQWMAETFDGRPVNVSVQPNLQAPQCVDGDLLIPDTWQWLPLESTQSVSLVGGPEDVGKEASVQRKLASVEVRCGGHDSFSISGYAVDKLASDERQFLSQDQALFLLTGLGAKPEYAQRKLAEAYTGFRPAQVRIGRFIKTASEVWGDAYTKAEEYLQNVPVYRHRLWKEASVIPDPVAVDTVLSLGFINPENLAAFVGYLPILEEAQSRLCELVLASRVGLREVPIGAVEKAVRALEEVLNGLKVMAFQS